MPIIRRHVFVLPLLAICAAAGPTLADETAKRLELTKSMVQTQRKAAVAANLPLTREESDKFWPLYGEYRNAVGKLSDRSVQLVRTYAENYNKLSDELAKRLLDDYLAIEKEQLNLKQSYARKFSSALPPKKLTRYMQIENKLDALLRAQIAQEIPLVSVEGSTAPPTGGKTNSSGF